MSDLGYVVAAYGVILGGLALYTVTIWRRLRSAQGAGADPGRGQRAAPDADDEAR